MQTATAVGFYGKLPCNGDFLQRRVPQEFIDVWDPWLQECIHASREALREDWLNAYLTSPVWRFVLAEGVCGSGAYAGVMLPSVDRVGRYFPLTIVAQLNVDDCVLEIACDCAQQWFTSAEALALGALEAADLDLVTFDTQVASLADQMWPHATE
jgi:type VI secretion system protein ImpM